MTRHLVRLAGAGLPARGDARGLARLARASRAALPAGSPAARSSARSSSSLGALEDLLDQPATAEGRTLVDSAWTYVDTGGLQVDMAILVDPLSVFMCLVVSGVSFLIHVYSVAYMGGDRGYARYFAYLNYFVFSMLLLVLAANFVLLIVGWAFVGAASYLLISFWYRRSTATDAGHQGVRDQRDRRRGPA